MKSREQRDGESVLIVTTMLWFAGLTVAALLLHATITRVTGLQDSDLSVVLLVALLGCAAVAPLRYLYRNRRP